MSSSGSGNPARAPATFARGLAALAASSALSTWSATTSADTPPPLEAAAPAPTPSRDASFAALTAAPFVVGAALRVGAGPATLNQDGEQLADLVSGAADLGLTYGTFVSDWLEIGLEVTLGYRRVLGGQHRTELGRQLQLTPIEGGMFLLLPLGGYFELHPSPSLGLFVGVHVGAGVFWAPPYLPGGTFTFAGTVAAELGYGRALSRHTRWAILARYGATGVGRYHIDEDYTNTQNSGELTLGLRLSAF